MSYDEWRFTFGAKTKAQIDAIPQIYLSVGNSVWNSDLKKPEYVNTYASSSTCNNGMDVVFVVDYTGSMGSAINNIKTSITTITNRIITESGNDYRLGLVIFDEQLSGTLSSYSASSDYTSLPAGQKYVNIGQSGKFQWLTTMQMMATNNITSFTTQLTKLNGSMPLGSGIGGPEPSDLAVSWVNNQNFAGTFRSNVAKLIILITDQLPSWDGDVYNQSVIDRINNVLTPELQGNNVKVLLMSTYSANALDTMALATGGVVSTSFAPDAIVNAITSTCSLIAGGTRRFVNEDCVMLVNNTGATLSEGQIVRISNTGLTDGVALATASNDDYLCGVVYRGGADKEAVVIAIQGEYKVKIFAGETTLPVVGNIVSVSTTPGEGDMSGAQTGSTNIIGVSSQTITTAYPSDRLIKCMIQNFQAR